MVFPEAKAVFLKFLKFFEVFAGIGGVWNEGPLSARPGPPEGRGRSQAHRRRPPHRMVQISGIPDTFLRKRGIALRINETYEHDSILSCSAQTEEACPIGSGCNKISAQCVDVSAPMTLTPTASIGSVSVTCQGSPAVTCVTDPAGTCCTVTMTQQICVSVPVRYGVTMTAGDPTIACAAPACSCGA